MTPSPRVSVQTEDFDLSAEVARLRARDLREHVVAHAERLGISADFLLSRRALDHWARHDALPDDLRGWREGVLGL